MHLYNTQLRKETPNAQSHSPEGIPTHPSEVKSGYKVRELIHSTQESDQKMLGIGGDVGLRFRVDDFSRRERSSARDTYNARVKRSGF